MILGGVEYQVTSWDTDKQEERGFTGDSGEGRSFVRCITQFDDSDIYDCQDVSTNDKGTCRMVRSVMRGGVT